jgi:hypothetical protein
MFDLLWKPGIRGCVDRLPSRAWPCHAGSARGNVQGAESARHLTHDYGPDNVVGQL